MEIQVSEKVHNAYKKEKEKYPNHVVFILDGKFYRTFDADACIIWYLMGYKIKNNFIGFPKLSMNKVVDELQLKGINYYIQDININSNISDKANNYTKVKLLSIDSYSRLKNMDILTEKIEKILLKDPTNYKKIKEYLDSYE